MFDFREFNSRLKRFESKLHEMHAPRAFDQIDWSSKPSDIHDLEDFDRQYLSPEVKSFIKGLKVYTGNLSDTYPVDPQYYLIRTGGTLVLVDNQGYDYARYALALPKNL